MQGSRAARPPKSPEPVLARVALAVDALRAGHTVNLDGFAVQSVEAGAAFRRTKAWLVLTHARARTLRIRLYTPEVVALPIRPGMDLRAIADPTADLETPLKGPFEPLRDKLPETFAASVKLAKLAGLLPATILRPGAERGAVGLSRRDLKDFDRQSVGSLKIVTRAHVPLAGAETAELVAFRAGTGAPENLAIVIGNPPTGKPVLTRLHSECFTGDLLGSLKCDCGEQLRGAVALISKGGGGLVLYLAQEGRGIGLINKLRAYRLQDQGFDTLEANERLGFEADERRYAVAAKMLSLLGYKSVRLLTNNPEKVAGLKAEGIKVTERVPHRFPSNAHNRGYLRTKVEKGGHLL